MKRRLLRILSAMAVAVLLSACRSPDYNAGKAEADKAIDEGMPVLETYGIINAMSPYRAAVLKEYGVSIRDRGCAADDALMEHARGVNKTTEAWLKERYGDDILQKIDAETDRRFRLGSAREHPSE